MDSSKRKMVRNSLFGALATVLPVTMLEAMAADAPTPETLADTVDALNVNRAKPSPVVFDDDRLGKISFEKTGEKLKAFKLPAVNNGPKEPLADGEYVLGKMGKFSVRDRLVKSSKINPLAQDLIKTNQLKTSESISQYSISERK